jgi:hypothetical protein
MNRRGLLTLLASPCLARGQAASAALAPQKICAIVEPSVLTSALARPVGNSRRTIFVPARENDDFSIDRLTGDDLRALNMTLESFSRTAAAVASKFLLSLQPKIERDSAGALTSAVFQSKRHLTSSLILSSRLLASCDGAFGDKAIAILPDQFTLYLFPRNFSKFAERGRSFVEAYENAVWPSSLEAFEVSADGVRTLGAFDQGGL